MVTVIRSGMLDSIMAIYTTLGVAWATILGVTVIADTAAYGDVVTTVGIHRTMAVDGILLTIASQVGIIMVFIMGIMRVTVVRDFRDRLANMDQGRM
jgi:thiamine biosynthesis lipoprotein ApbE